MDRLAAMRIFTQVALTGSFTETAEQLTLSRAMVSRCISELEEWLQVRLLQRTTRRVTLTAAGSQFLHRCQQILELTDQVVSETMQSTQEIKGLLRLTCSTSFAYSQLSSAIAGFLCLHPNLKIEMIVGDTILNMLESQIDLAIRISNNPDPGLISRRLGSCKSVLLASPSYLDSTGRPQSPEALTQHQCLSHSTTGKQLWQFNRGQELVKVEIDSHLTCNDASVLLHAALAGAGLTIQPTYLVQDYINSGKLEVVLPQWQVPELAIQALYPSRKHLPLPLRSFLDFLATHFATPRW